MALQDRLIVCRDCGRDFTFTTGEQEFYQSKGLQNDPVRCPECRSARKSIRTSPEAEAGYVRYGGAASFGGRTPRQMHPAACAMCGDMIEVPFLPRGDRPVFCTTVKRIMTLGYQMDEIQQRWGIHPCQVEGINQDLRRGLIPPKPGVELPDLERSRS